MVDAGATLAVGLLSLGLLARFDAATPVSSCGADGVDPWLRIDYSLGVDGSASCWCC
jgi:hypothetical protein